MNFSQINKVMMIAMPVMMEIEKAMADKKITWSELNDLIYSTVEVTLQQLDIANAVCYEPKED